jgi:hypothetical protein
VASSHPTAEASARRRRRKITLLVLLALLLLAALTTRWLLQPERLTPAILDLLGDALGLEISASGIGEYRLRGTPQLIVRGVSAREPGAATPVLTAERILISVPWSTLRARGRELTATRLELDVPVLDVTALQAWLDKRPPGETRIPTLTDGLRITRGRVDGQGWSLQQLHADVPRLSANQPLRAQLRGTYAGGDVQAPFDLALTLIRPALPTGAGLAGTIAPASKDWRLPARLKVSGHLRSDAGMHLQRLRLGASARYIAGDTSQPFALGLGGSLRIADGQFDLQPLALDLRGGGAVPTLGADGELQFGSLLSVALQGQLAQWPDAWPALPAPLGRSQSPLPFALNYRGPADLSAIAHLRLQRDSTLFDGRFRLFEMQSWIERFETGSPLPPLRGSLSTPRLEISGAVLEGVEVQIEDPTIPAQAPIE